MEKSNLKFRDTKTGPLENSGKVPKRSNLKEMSGKYWERRWVIRRTTW